MRWGIVLAMLASLFAVEAVAGSVLVYDGRGKLDRVIRPSPSGFVVYDDRGRLDSAIRSSPSGFIVYDGHGKIVSAIRQTGLGGPSIIDPYRTTVRVIGTGLFGEVSSLKGGVGFE